MNIIIVEDESLTALFLQETLVDLNHTVVNVVDNSNELFEFLKVDNNIDLIFMDINIKGGLDGIQTAQIIKQKYPDISFVFVTSYKEKETIQSAKAVKPLGYIVKPVVSSDIEAVMMVVEATKETPINDNKYISIGKYTYNMEYKVLFKNSQPIILGKNELLCIEILILNKSSIVSMKELMYRIWNNDNDHSSSLRELISRLRKKLPDLEINSIPNIGYCLRIVQH